MECSFILNFKASDNDHLLSIHKQITNVEMPPTADSYTLTGAEELSQIRRESTGPSEFGNFTPLQLFEFIQIATQLDAFRPALSFILVTILVKNMNLAWHRSTQRLSPQVFCRRIPLC